MRRLSVFAVFAVLISSASSGLAEVITTINFDDIAGSGPGITLGSPYESKGIVFTSNGFAVTTSNDPSVIVPTQPNFLNLDIFTNPTASLHFVQPGDTAIPAVVDYFAFDNVGLNSINNGWYNGVTVTTFDINNNPIGSFTVNPVGPGASRPVAQLAISEPGIHSVTFQAIPNPFNAHALAPVDDFSFGQPTAVPEPGFLLPVAASLLLTTRRRNGSAGGL